MVSGYVEFNDHLKINNHKDHQLPLLAKCKSRYLGHKPNHYHKKILEHGSSRFRFSSSRQT